MRKLILTLIFLQVYINLLNAQIVKSVMLDSVMIESVKKGFDVEDFIFMVQQDTSFLKAFRNLRNSAHSLSSNTKVYNNKKRKIVSWRSRSAEQFTANSKRWMTILKEESNGKFYGRNTKPVMYTVELFDELFYYSDTLNVVDLNTESEYKIDQTDRSNTAKLKQLLFNPGTDVKGVPVIGDRVAIFDDSMTPYYRYKIRSDRYNDSIPCYVFSCEVKKDAGSFPVLQYMNTWFDKRTFNIVFREYHYSYIGLLFEFDVKISVKMKSEADLLYPGIINYSGYWDLPFKRRETVDLDVEFTMDKEP